MTREVNCHIPLRLRVVGDLDDARRDSLRARLVPALTAQIGVATQIIEERVGAIDAPRLHAPTITFAPSVSERQQRQVRGVVTQSIEAALRESGLARRGVPASIAQGEARSALIPVGYRSPHSADAGQHARVARRPGPRWIIRNELHVRMQLRRYIQYLEFVGTAAHAPSDIPDQMRALYAAHLDEVYPATVWLVVARDWILAEDLAREALAHFTQRVPSSETVFEAHAFIDAPRRELVALAEGAGLARLPNLASNRGRRTPDGRVELAPGGMMLFTAMALPIVRLGELAASAEEIAIPLHFRDLGFLVDPESFARIFEVSWADYIGEWGDEPVMLRILPVFPLERVAYDTLNYLVHDGVRAIVPTGSWVFGELRLFNQRTMDWLPPTARRDSGVIAVSDSAAKDLPAEREQGMWEPNWSGAFVYVVLGPDEAHLNAARFRPEARRVADRLLPYLNRDPRELSWAGELLGFLRRSYEEAHPNLVIPRATAFEFLLAELEVRGLFDRLFTLLDQAFVADLSLYVMRLALQTRYANHPRILQMVEFWNAQYRRTLSHTYLVREGEIWLEHRPDWRLRIGQVLGEIASIYTVSSTGKRLKETRRQALRAAIEDETGLLYQRMLRGQETRPMSQEQLANTILAAAAQRTHITNDDFEEVTVERSARLVGLTVRTDRGITYTEVAYDIVERINSQGSWETVEGGHRVERDSAFELFTYAWVLQNEATVIEAFSIGVAVIAVIAVAWEVGAIAFLVELGGGATTVGISIGLSEAIYLFRVAFGDARFSLEGFLMAALDGYLMSVGFRGAGFLGRGAARLIGTQSLERIVGGWVAERLVVGTVGGAGTAALTMFSHDLINVLANRGRWTSPGEYVRQMGWGALFGVVFEFGAGALQPILRVGGRSGLETLAEAVQRVRDAGLSPARWTALMAEALGKLERQFGSFLESAASRDLMEAFRERIAQVSARLGGEIRLALFRRILELSPEALTSGAVGGLEKFLTASATHLSDEAIIGLLNRLSPAQLRRYLEALNLLADGEVGLLAAGNHLETLADSPHLLTLFEGQGHTAWELLHGTFGGSVPATERFLTRLSRHGAEQQTHALDILRRPGQRITPDGLLSTLDGTGTLADTEVAGLDRLYGTRATHAALNDLLRTTPHGSLARLLRFAGALEQEAVDALAVNGQLEQLAKAPALLGFADSWGATRAYDVLSGPFGGSIAQMEPFVARLNTLDRALQSRAQDILLRANQRITSEGLLQTLERAGGLDDPALAGLDRLYGTALERDAIDALLRDTPQGNLVPLLEFLGERGVGDMTQLANDGYIPALARSPRVLDFTRRPGNLRAIRSIVARGGNAADVIGALEAFMERNATLSADEMHDALVQVRDLLDLTRARGIPTPAAIETAAEVGGQAGYPGGQAARDVRNLLSDNTVLPVARRMLELPAGAVRVDTAGPGVAAPDVLFTTADGGHIGREATSSNIPNTRPETAANDLTANLRNRLLDKVGSYGPGGTADRPGLNYRSREIDLQVRPSGNGVNFDALLTPDFLNNVMDEVRRRDANLGRISRIRFYDSRGALIYTWTP